MKRKELDNILRNLLVAGNIVTVPFEQMREIRKELDRFVKPIQIEIIKSDFLNCFIQRIKIKRK